MCNTCGCKGAETFEARENKDGTIVLSDAEFRGTKLLHNGNYLWYYDELKYIDRSGLKHGNKFEKVRSYNDVEMPLVRKYEKALKDQEYKMRMRFRKQLEDYGIRRGRNRVNDKTVYHRSEGFEAEDIFSDKDEAMKRAKELGTTEIHSHKINGDTIYMPFKTHEEYKKMMKAKKETESKGHMSFGSETVKGQIEDYIYYYALLQDSIRQIQSLKRIESQIAPRLEMALRNRTEMERRQNEDGFDFQNYEYLKIYNTQYNDLKVISDEVQYHLHMAESTMREYQRRVDLVPIGIRNTAMKMLSGDLDMTLDDYNAEGFDADELAKSRVLDKIIAWHERNQLQGESIQYELDRIKWMLENPNKDYDEYPYTYDGGFREGFEAETFEAERYKPTPKEIRFLVRNLRAVWTKYGRGVYDEDEVLDKTGSILYHTGVMQEEYVAEGFEAEDDFAYYNKYQNYEKNGTPIEKDGYELSWGLANLSRKELIEEILGSFEYDYLLENNMVVKIDDREEQDAIMKLNFDNLFGAEKGVQTFDASGIDTFTEPFTEIKTGSILKKAILLGSLGVGALVGNKLRK